jgi:hypothetical protein
MTLTEFRKNPKLVKAASRMSIDPTFKLIMGVIWEQHPMFNMMSRMVGCPSDSSAYQLGTIDGANRVISVLQQLGEPLTEGTELKATYEPPERNL